MPAQRKSKAALTPPPPGAFPRLYFIRHGETDWNKAGRLQGQIDVPLNDHGRGQARRNGEVLTQTVATIGALNFIASPLLRTRETMEIIRAAAGLAITDYRTEERLKEIRFGLWEGKSWDELKRTERTAIRARKADPFHYVVPEGESYAMLSARVLDWLAEVKEPTVVVAHGGIMRCLQGHALGVETDRIPKLETPQDRILVIEPGRIDWL